MAPAPRTSRTSPARAAGKARKTGGSRPAPQPKLRRVKLLGATETRQTIEGLAGEIQKEFTDPAGLLLLGIRTRGVALAERIKANLDKHYNASIPIGSLDITLYRDDLTALGSHPVVKDSEIPFNITDCNVVLVDDVLYTGRTIRAAMDEVVDFGRPALIRLAVLIDRGCREYPIRADYAGRTIATQPGQRVHVHLREIDEKDEVVLESAE